MQSSPRPTVARALYLAAIALLGLVGLAFLLATWDGYAGSIFGWDVGADNRTITYVTPGGPAHRAGIVAGDRVDWRSLPLLGRMNLALNVTVAPGSTLEVTIEREGSARTVTLAALPWGPIVEWVTRAQALAALVLLAIGVALVYLRPTRMTWGFLLSTLYWTTTIGWNAPWIHPSAGTFALIEGLTSLQWGLSLAGILIFMSRFPSDSARGPLALLDRAAIPIGVAATALAVYVDVCVLGSPTPPPVWATIANQYVIAGVVAVLAVGALVTSFALARGSDRQRILPVLLAFAFYVALAMAQTVYNERYTDVVGYGTVAAFSVCSMLALAVAVAYGVLRSRVLDVSFAISRTLVYTILTTIVVGAFALIDFVSSKLLERLQITLLLEVCAALAFAIWLNALHARIDRFVDRVLFRRRYLAQARLERVGRTLDHAESAAFVDEALVVEPCDAFALASAAVLRRAESGAYERVFALGWEGCAPAFASDDRLVVTLLAELDTVALAGIRGPQADTPSGIAQPLLALPLVVRHEMNGFVLYGGHVGGEGLDPDEVGVLERLVHAAAGAYEHIRTKAAIAESDGLRSENAILLREQKLLREMVETLRDVSHSGPPRG
jgi:hypothetical protein